MELHKISETWDSETIGWTPVPGAAGYKFTTNGRTSHTWDGARSQVRIAKGAALQVEALAISDTGSWPNQTSPFGSDLFDGFEWAQEEPSGPVINVTTTAQLRAAINTSGAIIDGGDHNLSIGGQLTLPPVQSLTTLRNITLGGGRVLHRDGKWRLRNVTLEFPPVAEEDCVKGDDGAFLDLDGCTIRSAPRQGILLAPHSDVVIRNCRVLNNGRDGTFDHGIYTANGQRLLMFNCHFENNKTYQLHMYPAYTDARIVCNTFSGGKGSILSGVKNAHLLGNIFENSVRYGIEQLQPCTNVTIGDCLGRNNTLGAHSMGVGTTVVGWRNGGSPAGIISQQHWPVVPPTDINGRPRVVADAGAYAA